MNYKYSEDIEAFALQINCSVDEVIDLSSTMNFVQPEINIDLNTISLSSYPNYNTLYTAISRHFEINSNQIELFNGKNSSIFSLMNHFKNHNCYIYSPASLEYKKAAQVNNKNIELVNRFINLEQDIEENSLVVFENPSTPDGTLYDITKLLEYWDKKNCIVIIDESFLEFTNALSASVYLEKYSHLYIIKSMTNFYSCPGVRIGCVLSSKQNILQLKNAESLWKISQLDSAYIQAVLKDNNFRKISLAVHAKAKADLELILKKFNILFEQIAVPMANFVLVRLKTMKASEFQQKLIPYKVMVQNCSCFDFLDDEYICIAVKSQKNIQIFKEAIKNIVTNL